MFEDKYVSEQHKHHFHKDFLFFKQESRVEQYTTRFQKLSIFSPGIADDEEDIKAIYVEGLHYSIRWVIPAPDECTMIELCNQAIRAKRDDLKPKRANTGDPRDKY